MSVAYDVDDAVAVVRFDRPEVLNAFDDEMGAAALDAVSKAASEDSVRCIVITGSGRAFSSGEDLAALADTYAKGQAPGLGDTLVRRYNPLIRAITGAPKPVIAAVNGVAAGAGASVVLACDFRIASDKAKLVLAFIKVGLVPYSGAVWLLARMIGSARTLELALSVDPVDAQTALQLGLFDRVTTTEDFEQGWRDLARQLAAGPTTAYGLTKELTYKSFDRSLDEQLHAEVDAQSAAGRTKDHLEGMNAFFEKRPPDFTGR
jgi:2-(1,2-epoxy-1,2-dihydrophenyl)acetyl-CoA isomerase